MEAGNQDLPGSCEAALLKRYVEGTRRFIQECDRRAVVEESGKAHPLHFTCTNRQAHNILRTITLAMVELSHTHPSHHSP